VDLGCNTLQIFSHNPRGWAFKDIPGEGIKAFVDLKKAHHISPIFIHTSYLINPASRQKALRTKSIEMIRYEMDMADRLSAEYVVLHPGSASGDDPGSARKRVIDALSQISDTGKWKSGLLLENTAGQRGDIASKIQELAEIIKYVKPGLISGVCLDTCHAFSAGYNIRLKKGINALSDVIDQHLGKDGVKLLHVNDSKTPVNSGRDRHEHIGKGEIGTVGLKKILTHPSFRKLPIILETPKKTERDDVINLRKVRKIIESTQGF
jgi:deoxyribonuclease-4